MFRKLSLKALYETHDEMTLKQRLVYTFVMNACPVVVFVLTAWAFKSWVWPEPNVIYYWK